MSWAEERQGGWAGSNMSKMSGRMTDKDLKDQGNKYFNANKFDSAIESYSKAIALNPNVPTYYTNRALCYMKNNRWGQAVQDSRAALDRESGLVKGHFYLGTSLLEMDKLDEAIKHLQTAFELAKKDPGSYYDDTISSKLRLARKKKWNLQEEKRIQQEIEMQSYINGLIIEDRDRKMDGLKKDSESYDEVIDDISKVEAEADRAVAEVNGLFARVDEARGAGLHVRENQLRDPEGPGDHPQRHHVRPARHHGAPGARRALRPRDQDQADPGHAHTQLCHEGGGGRLRG